MEDNSCLVGLLIFGSIAAIYSRSRIFGRKANDFQGEDNCFSLFYDKPVRSNGSGLLLSELGTVRTSIRLKQVEEDFKKIPSEIYSKMVELSPIVCVDVVCRRKSDGNFLLFLRRDKPAAGIWWWPGGRMYRGESFYDTAIRKIQEEASIAAYLINPLGVIETWNTFFPDSSWDHAQSKGRSGTQTVNIVVCCTLDDTDYSLNGSGQNLEWAVANSKWISYAEGVNALNYDKYVNLNLEIARRKGFL